MTRSLLYLACLSALSASLVWAGPGDHLKGRRPGKMRKHKGERAPASDPTGPAAREVRGVFALSSGTKSMSRFEMTHPDLTGVSLRAPWSEIEPEPQRFRWTFDADMAQARQAGKQVMLRVSPGMRSPRWIYEAGVKPFVFRDANRYHQTEGNEKQIPIPWDPVFLKTWCGLIQAMGRKYAGDSSVVLIQMAGPTTNGAEMHLPRTPADKEHWQQLGYTKEKLVAAWRTVIDAYDQAFPHKPLALNVSAIIFEDGALEEITAYASKKLGKRFCVQHDALAAKTKENGFLVHKLVRSYRGKATIGFQLLCCVTPRAKFNPDGQRFGGTLKQAFDIGLRAGASYFEIYPVDLKNQAAARDIHELALTLAH